ncbi:hypothetical protein BUZ11_01380 [Staphylococcus gallinarum]|nr:hypothetical protein BUZ00_12295 [Staphylococcus gallinarum]PTK88530.1 hypothetical protein BUZ03_13195 [Staphylococcus gallinarum]PTL09084.1 hypothetical protein BUZ15_09010 [Staphylococcus gallinarum]PTL12410.1 hypothetical protein BUZ09_01120 [Staphylococcus gallinarum]PTL18194.1 hypothetical protein BUZ08_02120 [Staphylococcus gallinarum]
MTINVLNPKDSNNTNGAINATPYVYAPKSFCVPSFKINKITIHCIKPKTIFPRRYTKKLCFKVSITPIYKVYNVYFSICYSIDF